MPGPVPKKDGQRRRRTEPAKGPATVAPGKPVTMPPPDPAWYPPMARWYESLAASGQSEFYASSDWMTAWVAADSMSRELLPQPLVVDKEIRMVSLPPKAATFAAWLKACSALMATEGDRRRLRLELTASKPAVKEGSGVPGSVTDLRSRLRDSAS